MTRERTPIGGGSVLADLHPVLKYVAVFMTGLVVAWLATPPVRRLAFACGLVDWPEARRIHRVPTPRCGLPVFLGFHAACAVVFLVPWKTFVSDLTLLWWTRFFLLSSLLLIVGLIDDRWNLPAGVKLFAQTAVAALAVVLGMRAGFVVGVRLPPAVDVTLSVLWFLLLINPFNLVDGIDGLAAGLALIASVGLADSFLIRHVPGNALVLIALSGACLGFLRHNFYPATIFLGDSGSMFLGATLVATTITTGAKTAAVATLAVPLLAMGVPLLDLTLAVWRRLVRRAGGVTEESKQARVFRPDLDHLHHRLLRNGLSPRSAALWLYGWGIFLIAVGLLRLLYRPYAMGLYLLAFLVAARVVVRYVAPIELQETAQALAGGVRRPQLRHLVTAGLLLLDFLALTIALGLATVLLQPISTPFGLRRFWIDRIPLWVGLPFLALFPARIYERVWSRARVWEYLLLAAAVIGGAAVAAALDNFIHLLPPRDVFLHAVLVAGVALPLMAGVRALPQIAPDLLSWDAIRRSPPDPPERLLVWGLGPERRNGIETLDLGGTSRFPAGSVIGWLSEEADLYGRRVGGIPVLGGLQDLERVASQHRVTTLLLTQPLEGERRTRMSEVCRRRALRVFELRTAWHELPLADPHPLPSLQGAPPANVPEASREGAASRRDPWQSAK